MIRFGRASSVMRWASLLAMSSWLAIGDAGLRHSCPASGGAATAPSAGEHADHSAHQTTSAPEEQHDCNCVGECSAVSGIVVPAAAAATIAEVAITAPTVPAPAIQLARRAAHYTLPYSNGPPGERLVS